MANQSTIISMTSNRYLGHYIESWWVNYDRYWEELLMGIIDSKETLGTIVYLESSLGEEVIGKVLGEFLERSVKWCDNKSEVIEMSF